MPRQLTPEEQRIIRQTEDEGRRLHDAAQTGRKRKISGQLITGILIYAGVFILFALIAYFVVSRTSV